MATRIYSSGGQFTIDQDGVIRGINFEDLTYGVISTTDTIEFRDNSIDIIYTDIVSEVQNEAGTPIGTIDDINTYIESITPTSGTVVTPDTEILIKSLDDLLVYPIVNTTDIQLPVAIYKFDIADGDSLDIAPYTIAPTGVIEITNTMQSGALVSSDATNPLIKTASDLYIRNIALGSTATSNCIEMTATTGFEALDMNTVTFTTGSCFGTINGIRQIFWRNGFSFSPTKGFLLQGDIAGISIFDTRLINQFQHLLKADTGFTCDSIRSNINADVPTGSILFDIDYININEDTGYSIEGARLNGTSSNGTGLAFKDFTTGDIGQAANSAKSLFEGNTGVLAQNTRVGAYWTVTTAIATSLVQNVSTKILGTTTASSLTHFTQTASNELTYGTEADIFAVANLSLTVDSQPNAVIRVEVVRYAGGLGGTRTVVSSFDRIVNNNQGGVDLAFFSVQSAPFMLSNTDVIQLEFVNTTGNQSATLVEDSGFNVVKA